MEINISSAERSAIIAKFEAKTVDKLTFDKAYDNLFGITLHQHYTKFVDKQREEEAPKKKIGNKFGTLSTKF
jgi:hypothetical protein